MSSLRIAHTSSRERDRTSSSSGGGGITNEAFAQSSVSLYKRISSTENLTALEQHPQSSCTEHQPNYHQSNTSQQHSRMSATAVLTVPTPSTSSAGGGGSSSPKGGSRSEAMTIANNSSPGSSGSSTTAYYQHQLHAHPGTSELIAIKSKVSLIFVGKDHFLNIWFHPTVWSRVSSLFSTTFRHYESGRFFEDHWALSQAIYYSFQHLLRRPCPRRPVAD